MVVGVQSLLERRFHFPPVPDSASGLNSDASGSWGTEPIGIACVAWQGLPIASATIAPKELFPISVT